MEAENERSFSMQAELIRQIQEEQGHVPCYATPNSENCSKKKDEICRWRHDCYHEADMDRANRSD